MLLSILILITLTFLVIELVSQSNLNSTLRIKPKEFTGLCSYFICDNMQEKIRSQSYFPPSNSKKKIPKATKNKPITVSSPSQNKNYMLVPYHI